MDIEKGKIAHRVLRIMKHNKNGRTIYTVAPYDSVLLKTGVSYETLAPTSDLFVSQMYELEYDQIEYLEEPGIKRDASAGTVNLIGNSPAMNVGRNSGV